MSKLTQSARHKPCIKCGKEYETRACHFNGPRQQSYGKGMRIKAYDIATAEFCHECDQEFTEGSTAERWRDKWDRSEEFHHWIMMTNIRRIKDGDLKC